MELVAIPLAVVLVVLVVVRVVERIRTERLIRQIRQRHEAEGNIWLGEAAFRRALRGR